MSFEIFLQNKLNEHVIDLNDYNEDITTLDLNHLLKVVEDNAQIGYVLFKPEQYNESDINEIRKQIDNQSAENNIKFKSFTEDSVICLLANLTFNSVLNNFEDNVIKHQENDYFLNHLRKINQKWIMLKKDGWILEKKYKLSENDAYLFVNDKLKQAVVSFVSIKMKPADLFNDELKNEKCIKFMLDSVISIEILNEIVEKYNKYYFSFTGYLFGALLAEQSVILSQKYNRGSFKVKSTTFDSPGSFELLAYICRNFDLSFTLNDLKKLDIVTYISSPNFVNSFDTHVGKINYLYIDEVDLFKIEKDDSKLKCFQSQNIDILRYFYNALDDNNYSSITLVDHKYRNVINIKEKILKDFTNLIKNFYLNSEIDINFKAKLKYPFIFHQTIIETARKVSTFDLYSNHQKVFERFSISNRYIQEEYLATNDYCLNVLNNIEINLNNKVEFISLFDQISKLKNSIKTISIENLKQQFERLMQIKQLLSPAVITYDSRLFFEQFCYLSLMDHNLLLKS
jgi:hypothetical protein